MRLDGLKKLGSRGKTLGHHDPTAQKHRQGVVTRQKLSGDHPPWPFLGENGATPTMPDPTNVRLGPPTRAVLESDSPNDAHRRGPRGNPRKKDSRRRILGRQIAPKREEMGA